jgi:hypothetical protein
MLFGLLPSIGMTEILVLFTTGIFLVWPAWRICSRAGFPGPLGLLAAIPGLNLALLFFLVFAEWPALHGQGRRTSRTI